MSTLKVGTIQDHANSNTAMTIDSSGKVDAPVLGSLTRNVVSFCAIGPSTYTNYGASGVMSYNNTTSASCFDNSGGAYRVTADELRQFVERFENLEIEKRSIADQQKEVMAEAKGRGYDTKILRKIVVLRRRDLQDLAEEEAVLSMYKSALGM